MYKLMIVLIGILMVGCGNDQIRTIQGPAGNNGLNGLNSLIAVSRAAIDTGLCASGSGLIVSTGLDQNSNGVLDTGEVSNTQVVCDGVAGVNAPSNPFQVVDVVDPCGADQNHYNEVLLKLKNGDLLAYFKDRDNEFLSLLVPGDYRTTDHQKCEFMVHSDMSVTWER